MRDAELETRVNELATAFDKAKPHQRVKMQAGIERMIATLKAKRQAIPSRLRRIEAQLRDDEDDFFENMPI